MSNVPKKRGRKPKVQPIVQVAEVIVEQPPETAIDSPVEITVEQQTIDEPQPEVADASNHSWEQYLDPEVRVWLIDAPPMAIAAGITCGYRIMKFNTECILPQMMAERADLASGGSSYARGQSGEEYVTDVLNRYLHSAVPCIIERVGKVAKSGDIVIEVAGAKIIVEVKNYKSMVSQDEVDKFIRDIRAKNVDGGVFISLTSPISGINGTFVTRRTHACGSTKPIVFVIGTQSGMIIAGVESVLSAIETRQHLMQQLYDRDRIAERVKDVSDGIDAFAGICIDTVDDRDKIDRILRRNCDKMSDMRARLNESITGLRRELQTEYIADNSRDIEERIMSAYVIADECKPLIQRLLAAMMNCPSTQLIESTWKLTKNKAAHVHSNCGFAFRSAKVEFVYSGIITPNIIANVVVGAADKYKISPNEILIELNEATCDYLCEVLSGFPIAFANA